MATVSQIDFLGPHDLDVSGKPYNFQYDPPNDFPRTNCVAESHDQRLHDVRGCENGFSVLENGFGLLRIEPKMKYEDYDDVEKVRKVYCKQVADGVKDLIGASRVQIFDHTVSHCELTNDHALIS